MSDIEWTDRTWNPLVGCSRVSEGCRHCYAERFVHRGLAPQHRGLTVAGSGGKGPRWNGDVRFVEERLGEPLRWKRPARVFVNSLSDLFHESVSFETIAAIFGVMAAASRHTFQVLTKRPRRAAEFFAWVRTRRGQRPRHVVSEAASAALRKTHDFAAFGPWPLPNVWLGVSVEDQRTADERIPVLLELPAALRFVSYEPALGPVDFDRWLDCGYESGGEQGWVEEPSVDWIIVGGESGPGARPFDVAWARSTVEQCRAAGVPVFVKQLGAAPILRDRSDVSERRFVELDSLGWDEHQSPPTLRHRKGADPSEWPEDLCVREMP